MNGEVIGAMIVPPHPHLFLAADQRPGWQRLADAYTEAGKMVEELQPDVLIIYSTLWPSVIGHQIQAHPNPEWVRVDEDFHHLGSIPYKMKIDSDLAHSIVDAAQNRGLEARATDYHGFPIDVGSVVASKFLSPDESIPIVIVSSNMYADRAETVVLAKSCRDAIISTGRRAIGIVVMSLSNRFFTDPETPDPDRIHSQKDDEWNRKILEFLEDGRLEDVAQLSRTVQEQMRVSKVLNFKPAWWLSNLCGAHNHYDGNVLGYEAIHGSGAAIVTLWPSEGSAGHKEFDEDEVEVWSGDRAVLKNSEEVSEESEVNEHSSSATIDVDSSSAPAPVGSYPHARMVGDLLMLSGVGPRQAETNEIPGGPRWNEDGEPSDYDIVAQTNACLDNVEAILKASGSSIDDVVDITVFLVDMERDFAGFNQVYAERLGHIRPTRTTLEVGALPTPISVELKVMAHLS
ncbi:MAG: hypothetical protein CL992_01340 [Euryarchaeota archaeon]|nr:hypothetical protein [Euryarchaeota archaeon]